MKLIAKTVLAAAALSAAAPTIANAGVVSQPFSRDVTVDARDLNTVKGVDQVHARIVRAAERGCQVTNGGPTNLDNRRLERQCIEDAVDQALTKDSLKIVASYHDALSKRQRYFSGHAVADNWSVESFRMMAEADADAARG